MNEHVFALDIGTQSVTGILLKKSNTNYKIVDFCMRQHKERSMLDGQIQNVVQVADIISEVKKELEKSHGPLHNVCVAAAGRALKTIQAKKSIDIQKQPITTEEEIKHLELSAVGNALFEITKKNKQQLTHYHCVGYSVLHYKLDGEKIGSFIDQIGNEATVEVIATFLPKIVIESLLSALDRANLTMEALTLEPIAAIHVLVPPSMRRLNVALIDIGAGTSDIAISNNGTVIAYGMVSNAGDEITEAISDHYLLDFKIAENMKRKIVNDHQATAQNILGFETTVTYEELVPQIMDSIDELAKLLAQEIRLLNGKAPQAIMLIGGGSLTPKINEKIANYLQLPTNRVAMRGIEAIQYLEQTDELPTGPDFVTPIGIAISASQSPLHYITVYVNEKITYMFETKQLTVGDALIQAGIDINKYYGKIGLAAIATVNQKEMTLRGEYGKPPVIYVNGTESAVDSLIESEDKIIIYKGKDGAEPNVSIEDIVGPMNEVPFYYHNKKHILRPTYQVNGKNVDKDYIVQDKDDVIVQMPKTIHDFLEMKNERVADIDRFFLTVNDRKVHINEGATEILLNDQPTRSSAFLKKDDRLSMGHPKKITVKTLLDQLNQNKYYSITVTFNGELLELKQQQVKLKKNEALLDEDSELQEGDILTLTEKKVRPFIFQDIFRYVDIDLTGTTGRYELYRNNEPISFHDEIIQDDQLELIWD